ncbi:MAG: class I SAM-dependent methyltransferase [Actinobacteria bacterium]|nr:class I SAM-dependent methyltransferase [Actinomycetota bacterium]
MSPTAAKSSATPVERLRPLIQPRLRKQPLNPEVGYLDLSEDRKEPVTTSTIAMQLPLVSAIYERWWRPGLVRIAKGVNGPSMSGEYAEAQQMLKLKRGDYVLDLACGPGNFTRRFARTVAPDGLAVGYDGSRSMLERGVRELNADETPAMVLVRGEATQLPFEDETFDSVCCFAALHMFPEPEATLAEIARVLKPGGRVALFTTTVSGGGPPALAAHAFGVVSQMRMFREDEMRELLEGLGFAVDSQRSAGVTQLVAAVRA